LTATPRRAAGAPAGRPSVIPGPSPARAASRYWAGRAAAAARPAAKFTAGGCRLLARAAAAVIMMLASLAQAVRLKRTRQAPDRPAGELAASSAAPGPPAAQDPPAEVTVTASGMRVTDKRGAAARLAGARPAQAAAASPARARQPARLPRAATALCFTALGMLIRAGHLTPLPEAPDTDVGRCAWHRAACRHVLRDKSACPGDLAELIALAADEEAGDWRGPVLWWAKRRVGPAELTSFLQAELVRTPSSAIVGRRLILLLRLAGYAAAALPEADAREVVRTALACSRRQVNPYGDSGLTLTARSAVTVLLQQRPELDEILIRALELQAGPTQMQPGQPLPVEARLLAFAIRNRTRDFGAALTRVAASARFGPEQMQAAGRLADAPIARPARIRQAPRPWGPAQPAVSATARVLPWLAPMAVAAGAGVATHLLRWAPAPATVSLGDSIALLTLLAAVHVFTVQLSASRLPGVIARSAGHPWELFLSYSAALTLLVLSVFRARAAWLAAAASWSALAALALFAAGVVPAMFRLLRRTDAGQAAQGYVTRTLPSARAAGRKLGRSQARAVEMREALDADPGVRVSLDAFAGEWSQVIAARRRGFFMPRKAGLRRLLASSAFGGGMRMRVFAGPGTIVDAGEDMVSLIPARDQTISSALARQARRTLRTRTSRRVEDVATGAVALTQMALDLEDAGDIGTARTVAQSVVRLVTEHVAAARRARTQMFRRQEQRAAAAAADLPGISQADEASARARDNSPVPGAPALRDSLRIAVQGRFEGTRSLLNIPAIVTRQLLSGSGRAESAVTMATFSVPREARESALGSRRAAEMLRIAGLRALELNDSMAFGQVLGQLDKFSGDGTGRGDEIDITAMLASTACRFDTRLVVRATDRAIAQIPAGQAGNAAASAQAAWLQGTVLWRTGAAGLACGAMSVAVHAAHKAFELHVQDTVRTMASKQELITGEAARSDIHGGYLGDQAKEALASFGTFLHDTTSVFA
jgi:hypothetical protein